jgi:cytosine/adenosine deaminase-related metal-dependent hydrolase
MKKYPDEQNGYYGITTVSKHGATTFAPFGRSVNIEAVIDIFETRQVFLLLCYNYNGISKSVEISRGDLKKSILLDYAKMGMDVFEHTVHTLIQCLQKQEKSVKPIFGHEHVGFDTYVDENGVEHDVFKHWDGHGYGFESEYRGKLDIKPTGDRKSVV